MAQILCRINNYLHLLQTVGQAMMQIQATLQIQTTGTTSTQTSVTSTISSNPSNRYTATYTPVMGDAAKPEDQPISCPYTYKEMDMKGRLFTTGGESRDTTRTEKRGRTRGSYLIQVFK